MTKLKLYPKYKESGVEWLGKIPEEWKIWKSKYLLRKNEGGIWGDIVPNGITALRSTEITIDGKWKINQPAKIQITRKELADKKLKRDDLLVTKSSGSPDHIGKTAIVNNTVAKMNPTFSNFMQRLRPKKDKVSPKLFYYLLNSKIARIQYIIQQNATSGLGNLNTDILNNLVFALPKLDKQKKLVLHLDKKTSQIEKYTQKLKKQIKLLKEYRQKIISQAVTCGLDQNGNLRQKPKSLPAEGWKDSGVEWLGEIPKGWDITIGKEFFRYEKEKNTNEIEKNRLALTLDGVINREYNDDLGLNPTDYSTYQIFNRCDLVFKLIDITNKSTSRVGLVPERGIMSPAYIRLTKKDNINTKYYYYYYFYLYLIYLYNSWSTGVRASLTPKMLLNIPVPFLPKSDQDAVVSYLDHKTTRIDKQIKKIQKQIELMQEYKQSLISKVVTGKLKI